VGPRPCVPYEYEHYLPSQKQRFAVAPGLTGLWQVSGKNKTTFNEMIQTGHHLRADPKPVAGFEDYFQNDTRAL